MQVFEEGGNRSTRRKPLGAEQRTNKLNPHMTPVITVTQNMTQFDWKIRPGTIGSSKCSSLYKKSNSLFKHH